MSIVQAYKSDADGKLFEDKGKYISHLRKLAAVNIQKRRDKKIETERSAFLDKMGLVSSIDELKLFIRDNWKWFWANGARKAAWRYSGKNVPEFHEYVDVNLAGLHWLETVSNSHSCPRNGIMNFESARSGNSKPTGYPGWIGRINIKVRPPKYKYDKREYMKDGWGSDYFSGTTINTGSGGGGGGKDCKEYSYDVKLFAADFPVMYEEVRRMQWIEEENMRRQKMWNMLGGLSKTEGIYEVPEDWVCPDPLIPQNKFPVRSNYPY